MSNPKIGTFAHHTVGAQSDLQDNNQLFFGN
jgi:hypothetical protein